MTEFTMDRLRENLESLKMRSTLEILDNYLERAVAENLNIVDVLDHIFAEEAKSKRKRAYEKQIQILNYMLLLQNILSGFLMAFSAVLLLVCLVIIGHSLSVVVEQEKRDMAVLKTVGLSGGALRGTYLALYGGAVLLDGELH